MSAFQVSIDAEASTPPFEQVRSQIAAAVASGQLSAGTRLPTVRRLAADLGLAARTVARAYLELEADAVVSTHGRRGTFVRSDVVDEPATHFSTANTAHSSSSAAIGDTAAIADPAAIAAITAIADTARTSAADYVHTVRRLGLTSQEALRLVENAWNKGTT